MSDRYDMLAPDFHTFRTDRPGIRKVLGDLEADIMEFIWSCPAEQRLTVRDVFDHFYLQRHIAYTTVMTTMTRLAKKQVLRVEKEKQTYFYTPSLTQSEFISRFLTHLLHDISVSFFDETMMMQTPPRERPQVDQVRQLLAHIEGLRHEQEKED